MKILYAIQGTGNGHVSRAREIIPLLMKKGTLDILVSGIQSDIDLPYPVKYKFKGLSFIFGKNGGIDLMQTYKKSSLTNLYAEIKSLPIEKYDLVISDFEPVSSWACKMKNKTCIGLSHQSAVSNKKSPKPKYKDPIGKAVLKYYAPVDFSYGFHFEQYDKNIFTPVIRSQVRESNPKKAGHYTVYLPAYGDDRIIKVLSQIKKVNWQVFSKHIKKNIVLDNIKIQPIKNDDFIRSMVNSIGVLCGAGFETPAEALYLKKKLIVIPMKGQYEQQCNAASLKKLGVPVLKSLKKKHVAKIESWVSQPQKISITFHDETEAIIDMIIETHTVKENVSKHSNHSEINSIKELKEFSLEKIISKLST
jgi:uncharacterized protein (TIGR00661 family)